jgi:hypothetical protein
MTEQDRETAKRILADAWRHGALMTGPTVADAIASALSAARAESEAERDAIQETLTAVEHEVAIVYCHITDGAISKCNTLASEVKTAADDCTMKLVDREIAEYERRAEAAEREVAALKAQGACEWTEDSDGNWDTACGETFVLIDGIPTGNDMKFCCYCGKALTEVRYAEPPIDDEAPVAPTPEG